MRGIPFVFFSRVVLMTSSFVLAVLSLSTRIVGKEFVYAAGSIAAAMLASFLPRKRRRVHHHHHHDHISPYSSKIVKP